jgi:hypothetical protein
VYSIISMQLFYPKGDTINSIRPFGVEGTRGTQNRVSEAPFSIIFQLQRMLLELSAARSAC